MITPRFSVRQDDTSVYVTIHAPHVRAQTIEFDVADDQFKFYASPYYLRLTFPGNVVEDDGSTASFDAAAGDITVTLSKQTKGEVFENLDLLTTLLATKREREAGASTQPKPPVIEELDDDASVDEALRQAHADEDFDWEIPQTLPAAESEGLLTATAKYGFDQQYNGYLAHVHDTANEINEVPDPEHMSAEARRQNRISCEDAKFDEDYYMENYMNDEDIEPLVQHKSRFSLLLDRAPGGQKGPEANDNNSSDAKTGADTGASDICEFTDDEKKLMLDLPRRTHLISNKQAVYLGLVDLLFAYALDLRIHQGELSVESAWSIGALSSTLSNLDQFSTLRSVVVACFRRGLAYPLYRYWDLCEKALGDVYAICKLGRRVVLKAFIALKQLYDRHDIYYIYSKLYFDDYCTWLQTQASDKVIASLARKLYRMEIDKDEIGWRLDDYEDLALMSSESEPECDESSNEPALCDQAQSESASTPPKPLIQVVDDGDDMAVGSDAQEETTPSGVSGILAQVANGSSDRSPTSVRFELSDSVSGGRDAHQTHETKGKKPLIEVLE
ncbi:hypothetical protein GGF46_004586 [Coemansia sp. RSA 552]|nr:hypothetical protein GGF46_004586 [Coemansia sp. RSA 552]